MNGGAQTPPVCQRHHSSVTKLAVPQSPTHFWATSVLLTTEVVKWGHTSLQGHTRAPFRFASSSEKFLLTLALAAAISGGAVTVGNMLLFANMTDSMINFGSQVTNNSSVIGSDEFLDTLQRFAIGNSIIGGLVLILGYTSNFLFNYTAQKQIHRIRSKFLKSALHQDIAWYDLNQTGDFSSKLAE
uniref:ABC transmembrane type-1 domain-containing protein n=1 Tax=Timema cristinae TaxID=61476 RepID=A0A7R9CY73_TIMCR|nr:unnamed protein product [Timema cristinae]